MELRKIGEPISVSDISALEYALKLKLPAEYKGFLLRNNGGHVKGFLVTPEFTERNAETSEERILSISPKKFYSLEELAEEYDENLDDPLLPSGYLGIAGDNYRNQIAVCVESGESYGEIYFVNRKSYNPQTGFCTLTRIASGFDEFVSGLHPFEGNSSR